MDAITLRPGEVLVGDLVTLRRCRGADVDLVLRLVSESLAHLRPWMPWAVGDYDRAAAGAFVAACEDGWGTGDSYVYLIFTEGAPAGVCGLGRTIGAGGLELGYWLHPAYTGRGLATTASAALVAEAFALPGVERIQIWHDAANAASAGVPRRLGFVERERRSPPRHPLTSGEVGIDVIWQLDRPG